MFHRTWKAGRAIAALCALILTGTAPSRAQTTGTPEAAMAAADDRNRVISPRDMKQIADAIGARCNYCHTAKLPDGKPDYKAPSPLKETAKYMKTNFVDGLVTRDGKPVTCASCHAGKTLFLPRELAPDAPRSALAGDRMEVMKRMMGIKKALGVACEYCHAKGPDGKLSHDLPTPHKQVAKYMMTEIVDRYRLKDGGDLTCATCHAGRSEFLPHRVSGTAGPIEPTPPGKTEKR